jgi:hypothetical protein
MFLQVSRAVARLAVVCALALLAAGCSDRSTRRRDPGVPVAISPDRRTQNRLDRSEVTGG